MEKKSKKSIVFNIIIYSLVFLFFGFATIGIIFRASGNNFYLFGYRFDVVLTDSMSSKNPEYEDFLEGHDNQYQAFDVVMSKKVNEDDELSVYDVVLFDNPLVGTDMHRIVGKDYDKYNKATLYNSNFSQLNGYDGISFSGLTSKLQTNPIEIKEVVVKSYTTELYNEDHFYFNIMNKLYDCTREYTEVQGGYMYTHTVTRNDSNAPGVLNMVLCPRFNFEKEILLSCTITSTTHVVEVNKETLNEADSNLEGVYYPTYKYEIRGDKASTSDGEFTTKDIYSRVVGGVPKIGYIIRYLSSIWGVILFIGLGVIILAYDIISSRMERKEQSEKLFLEKNNEITEEKVDNKIKDKKE